MYLMIFLMIHHPMSGVTMRHKLQMVLEVTSMLSTPNHAFRSVSWKPQRYVRRKSTDANFAWGCGLTGIWADFWKGPESILGSPSALMARI
jgi:hypothetical protein